MTKYLVSAAAAAVLGLTAIAATPAAAQVGFSVNVGDGYHGGHRYHGDRYYGHRYYGYRPGVRVYTGRSSYYDDCRTKRTVKWRNGKKIVTTKRICD